MIRRLREHDFDEWLRMRQALWPESDPADLRNESAEYLDPAGPRAVFVVERSDGRLGGFVETSIRLWAEGCESPNVGYIEGWYVDEDLRRGGVGRALVDAAERWAREQGCKEMGSDAETWNQVSIEAHRRLGYTETVRIVCFRKSL